MGAILVPTSSVGRGGTSRKDYEEPYNKLRKESLKKPVLRLHAERGRSLVA